MFDLYNAAKRYVSAAVVGALIGGTSDYLVFETDFVCSSLLEDL